MERRRNRCIFCAGPFRQDKPSPSYASKLLRRIDVCFALSKAGDPMATRRRFLSTLAVPGLMVGAAPPVAALTRTAAFVPEAQAGHAAVFAAAREHFLIPPGVAYGNTGTLGASPREVVEALTEGIRRIETELAAWPYEQPDGEPLTGYQQLREVRQAAGRFVNASADEIALTQNATMGMNFLANGVDLAAGDEIVSTDQEHGGGISPWRLLAKRRGVLLEELPLEPVLAAGPEAIVRLFESALTPRTKVVVFSHITSGLGARLPARELCALARDHGALAIVDGAQAVGQIQVDVKALGCDAYVASPHKWMMAPKGTGFFYIRREVQDRFWTTLASYQWDNHADGAFRFMQFGTGSVAVVEGLMAALKFIGKIGMPRIEQWDASLTRRLRDGLAAIPAVRVASPADPRLTAAITTFRVNGVKAKALQDALWAKRVRVRAQNDERGIRLSAHMYVSPEDVDVVLDVTEEVAARA
jgi:selenocysteine lyase/cysteine desulfurase